jgi:hypothetical protein
MGTTSSVAVMTRTGEGSASAVIRDELRADIEKAKACVSERVGVSLPIDCVQRFRDSVPPLRSSITVGDRQGV